MSHTKFYFNPSENGLLVFLGPSETKIMEIAWAHKEISVKTALFYYPDKTKPAYTTVMTVLSRLAEKKILQRKKIGRSYIYTITKSKEDFLNERVMLIKSCLKQF